MQAILLNIAYSTGVRTENAEHRSAVQRETVSEIEQMCETNRDKKETDTKALLH